MINIAICDDEPVFLKQLHNRIRSKYSMKKLYYYIKKRICVYYK